MIEDLKPLLSKFMVFAKDRLNFQKPPRLFLKQDSENSKCMLGKTAHYDPSNMSVTLYVSGRHPKDIMRSFAHELVHHCQNERGDLAPEKMKTMNKNYAQENEHMRKMEEEAYLQGNMCFRDWEDGLNNKLKYKLRLAEHKFLKENKKMSVKQKLTKRFLKETITKLLDKKIHEEENKQGDPELVDDKGNPITVTRRADGVYVVSDIHIVGSLPKDKKPVANPVKKPKPQIQEEEMEAFIFENEDQFVDDKGNPITVTRDPKTGIYMVSDIHIVGSAPEEKKNKPMVNPIKRPKPQVQKEEAEINTPEKENDLYESRFSKRNTNLFEKLLKEWAK